MQRSLLVMRMMLLVLEVGGLRQVLWSAPSSRAQVILGGRRGPLGQQHVARSEGADVGTAIEWGLRQDLSGEGAILADVGQVEQSPHLVN